MTVDPRNEPASPGGASVPSGGLSPSEDPPGESATKSTGKGTAETPAKMSGKSAAKAPGKGDLRESLFLLAAGVVVAVLLQIFVFRSFSIPSESMENTLLEGDRVIVNKLHGQTERGDLVVFKGWQGEDTIKRVIAVGGDTVKCCDARRRITVNGVPLDEGAYLHPDDFPSGDGFEKVVPKGRLWLMGDHRSASADSRTHEEMEGEGTISEKAVIGRAFAIYWPFSRAALLPTPETFGKVR